jgi:hypothetical protein
MVGKLLTKSSASSLETGVPLTEIDLFLHGYALIALALVVWSES